MDKVYLQLHDFKKVVDMLKDVREKIMLGTYEEVTDVLADIDSIEAVLDNTQIQED